MSIIKFLANKKLPTIFCKDLYGNQIKSSTGIFEVEEKWYHFTINCKENEIIDFTDITINNESIEEQLYTGWATNINGEIRFIPFLNGAGKYEIWLHGNLGHYLASIKTKIKNGYYGKHLFDSHLLTVDYPIKFDFDVPVSIKSFFNHAYGPEWWEKDSLSLPYKSIDFSIENHHELLMEGMSMPKENIFCKSNVQHIGRKYKNDSYPLVSVEDIKYKSIGTLLKNLGYKKILNIMINTLPGKSSIYMHTDEDYDKKAYRKIMLGCSQLYVILEGDPKKNFLKLGRAGIVPFDKPVLINNNQHPHCLVNASDQQRTTLLAYGIRD